MPWYTGVLLGAERFMASWRKSQEEASRLREVNRATKALLANQKIGNAEEDGCGERERERARENVEEALLIVVITSEQSILCFVCVCVCVCVFIKLHITAQSGPVILVIICHSH